MGASFRSKEEVLALAGCDYLTIAPKLLQELAASTEPITPHLNSSKAMSLDIKKVTFDEKSFRWAMNEDPCVNYKLPVIFIYFFYFFYLFYFILILFYFILILFLIIKIGRNSCL